MSESAAIIITGGGGFLGQCLASTLLKKGKIRGNNNVPAKIIKVILADIHFPPTLQSAIESSDIVETIKGDVSDKAFCNSLYTKAISTHSAAGRLFLHVSVFHLGAVMSGDGERDFDLCMNVNLMGFLNMIEAARSNINPNSGFFEPAKFIFTSAGATIGSGADTDYIQKDDVIADSSRATPHTTYGATKACCELMLSDFSRRGFVDGRGIRLPTIMVRAGTPNAATTGCFSGIIREPLAGKDLKLPISKDVPHAVTGKRAAIDAMIRMHDIEKAKIEEVLGFDRTVFLPAAVLSLGQLEEALMKTVAPETASKLGKIGYEVDQFLSNVVAGFPTKIEATRALILGVPEAPDAETLVREYILDFPAAIVDGLEIIPASQKVVASQDISKPNNRKVAVITGGGSGIGRAVAIKLAKEEWNVVLAGRKVEKLLDTAKLLEPHGCQYLCVKTDVVVEKSVKNLFAKAEKYFGRVDLLFNNAGITCTQANIENVATEDFERVCKTNIIGPFLCAREAMKVMANNGGGRIINNGSISAQTPRPGTAAYTTSKHAVAGLTKSIALDGRALNIACGQIDFGNIISEMSLSINDSSEGALQANGTRVKEASMNLSDAANTVFAMANLPVEANILHMTVLATKMPFVGRG